MTKISNINYLQNVLKNSTVNIGLTSDNNIIINVYPTEIPKILKFLKNHTMFQSKLLLDVYAIDYPKRKKRFELQYMLLSLLFNYRIIVKSNIFQDQIVSSVMDIFNSANWLEREIWDMFGIFFKDHKDLRRILTDYGFEGFPLRKDFPLTGYLQFRYDDESQTVISEPVELTQEFRSFEYTMPWTEKE